MTLKTELGERFAYMEEKFSSWEERVRRMEEMLKKLVEAQSKPPIAAERENSLDANPNFLIGKEEEGSRTGGETRVAGVVGHGVAGHGAADQGSAGHAVASGGVIEPHGEDGGGQGGETGVWEPRDSNGQDTKSGDGVKFQDAGEGGDGTGRWGRPLESWEVEGYGARVWEYREVPKGGDQMPPFWEHEGRPLEVRHHFGGMGDGMGHWRGDVGVRKRKMAKFEGIWKVVLQGDHELCRSGEPRKPDFNLEDKVDFLEGGIDREADPTDEGTEAYRDAASSLAPTTAPRRLRGA